MADASKAAATRPSADVSNPLSDLKLVLFKKTLRLQADPKKKRAIALRYWIATSLTLAVSWLFIIATVQTQEGRVADTPDWLKKGDISIPILCLWATTGVEDVLIIFSGWDIVWSRRWYLFDLVLWAVTVGLWSYNIYDARQSENVEFQHFNVQVLFPLVSFRSFLQYSLKATSISLARAYKLNSDSPRTTAAAAYSAILAAGEGDPTWQMMAIAELNASTHQHMASVPDPLHMTLQPSSTSDDPIARFGNRGRQGLLKRHEGARALQFPAESLPRIHVDGEKDREETGNGSEEEQGVGGRKTEKEHVLTADELIDFVTNVLRRDPTKRLRVQNLATAIEEAATCGTSDGSFGKGRREKEAYGVMKTIKSTVRALKGQELRATMLLLSMLVAYSVAPVQSVIAGKLLGAASKGYEESTSPPGYDLSTETSHELLYWGIGYFCTVPLVTVATIIMVRLQATLIATGIKKLRQRLIENVVRSSTEMAEQRAGEIIPIYNTSLQRTATLWSCLFWAGVAPLFSLVLNLGFLLGAHWELGLLFIGVLPPVLFYDKLTTKAAALSKRYSSLNSAVAASFKNMLEVLPGIRAHDACDFAIARFAEPVNELSIGRDRLLRYASYVQCWYNITTILFSVFTYLVLIVAVATGRLDVGVFYTLTGLINGLVTPLKQLGSLARNVLQNAGSVQKLDSLLNERRLETERFTAACAKVSIGGIGAGAKKNEEERQIPLPNLALKGEIELRDVSFAYPSSTKLALRDVNLVIKPGTYTVLCGGSGSGKTTLLSLIMQQRFIPRNDAGKENQREQGVEGGKKEGCGGGAYLIGGVDVYDRSLRSFKAQTSVVFQQTHVLFGATVRENIAYEATVQDGDVENAARSAQIHDAIVDLPLGYDTVLSNEGGLSLSGGQLQRICLARALCRKPSLLLLDEATSASAKQ